MTKKEIYDVGYIDGLRAYAWWRDGVQYVGTTGTLLNEAIKNMEENWNYFPREVGVEREELEWLKKKIGLKLN